MDLSKLPDADLERDAAEIQAAIDTWANEARIVIPACLDEALGGHVAQTPRAWQQALTRCRDLIRAEQQRRAAQAAQG